MKLVFVAGPYCRGDVAANVKMAIDAGDKLMEVGVAVFVPHLSHFQHLVHPREEADWKANDNEILARCDAVFRLPGESIGADAEVALARELEIPVFDNWRELLTALHR